MNHLKIISLTTSHHHGTHTILIIKPTYFQFNPETQTTNTFMKQKEIQLETIQKEHTSLLYALKEKGITIQEITALPNVPESVFLNNWFSTHRKENQTILAIYPMKNPSRQKEVQKEALIQLLHPDVTLDFRDNTDNSAVEGTGAIVFDHTNSTAYAGLSTRCNKKKVTTIASKLGYRLITFDIGDVYHTNVLLSIGRNFVVICEEAINGPTPTFKNKNIITISKNQMENFCGNILYLETQDGKGVIAMSTRAYNNFTPQQIKELKEHGDIVHVPFNSIEDAGGGGVRCCLAENYIDSPTIIRDHTQS